MRRDKASSERWSRRVARANGQLEARAILEEAVWDPDHIVSLLAHYQALRVNGEGEIEVRRGRVWRVSLDLTDVHALDPVALADAAEATGMALVY